MDIQTILQIVVTAIIIPMAVKLSALDRSIGQLQTHIDYIRSELKLKREAAK